MQIVLLSCDLMIVSRVSGAADMHGLLLATAGKFSIAARLIRAISVIRGFLFSV